MIWMLAAKPIQMCRRFFTQGKEKLWQFKLQFKNILNIKQVAGSQQNMKVFSLAVTKLEDNKESLVKYIFYPLAALILSL